MSEHDFAAGHIHSKIESGKGILLNLYLSGSDLYGWKSNDSDIDYRGMYAANPRDFLGLGEKRKKRAISLHQKEHEYDTVIFEMGHAVSLALKGNSNLVEEFKAPQIFTHPYFYEIKEVLDDTPLNEYSFYKSCVGVAHGALDDVQNKSTQPVKRLLYAYRTLFLCKEYFVTGKIISNMNKLIELNDSEDKLQVKELLDEKIKGAEKTILTSEQKDLHVPQVEDLFIEVKKARNFKDRLKGLSTPGRKHMREASDLVADIRARMIIGEFNDTK